MILPQRPFSIGRTASFAQMKSDLRLVASTPSHSSSFMRIRRASLVIPALQTSMLTEPRLAAAAENISFTSAAFETSALNAAARPPLFIISAAASFAASAECA